MYFVSDPALWNHEFLKTEILSYIDDGHRNIYYKNKDHLLNIGFWNHVLTKKPEVSGNCIFHFSIGKRKLFCRKREANIEILKEVVKLLNPKCILFCGDEHRDFPEIDDFANHTTLFLREHAKQGLTNNTQIVPVGYSNEIGHVMSIKPCTQRNYHWSYTNPREDLDDALLSTDVLHSGHVGEAEKSETRHIYNESVFVPVVNKNRVLDSYTIYNALSSGAIPIVVGSSEEYREAFGNFLGTSCIPPWVHGETWEDVINTCKVVLDDEEMLTQLQKNCIIWWQNILSIYRTVLNPLWEE